MVNFEYQISFLYMISLNRYIALLCFLFWIGGLRAQHFEEEKESYLKLRSKYESFEENNEKALSYVRVYLDKAKKEKSYPEIIQGYKDIIFYTKEKRDKLLYSDSCVSYALKSKDNELISKAYLGKGIIYYFFYKQYQPALDQYLKAYEYSKKVNNPYLKNTITYHLGVVKSYLGYYDEALKLFDKSIAYFEPFTKRNIHPNIIFNNQKGYFNSLHQQIICYRGINNFAKSDSLIQLGLSTLPESPEFALEKAYFFKCLGISNFRKEKYVEAINNFSVALPELKKIDDFTWLSVNYFYTGKSLINLKNEEQAILYFTRIDSIFQKHHFILPEIRENYEILINHYHKIKNPEKELFYTKQLLKVDNLLNKDFKYLSSTIHKEYETKALLEKQKQLENKNFVGSKLLIGSSLLIIMLIVIIIYKRGNEKEIQKRYLELEKKILEREDSVSNISIVQQTSISYENRTGIPNNVVQDLLLKLAKFEQRKGFRKKGVTLPEMAKKFETNTTYLSQIINVYKGKNFNGYLNELRINYITNELYHNPKFLEYTIEGLANDCGVSSRQNFSDFFNEINGIRPVDFIRKRKAELKEEVFLKSKT